MPDKHIVLDRNAFADKGMAGYLAVLSDGRVFLDFNKSPDFAAVPDQSIRRGL